MKNRSSIYFSSRSKSFKGRFFVALLTVAIVFVSIYLAQFLFKESVPMSLFLSAVVVSAWFGGAHRATEKAKQSLLESQKEIEEQKRRAEEGSRVKSLFLANMSHEIRTPLMGILGFTELLKDSDLTESERQEYLSIIEKTGNNLSEIINDILDLSKIEADRLEVENVSFSLQNLMDELYALLNLKCLEKGITLQFKEETPVPDSIKSDPKRLRQILINLIGNSIKFTDKGSVHVSYRAEGENLVFKIKDTGIGISKEQQERLFQAFTQGDRSISRKFAGTGLGLSLSQQLAILMGGKIDLLESSLGAGSTFRLHIRFEYDSPQTSYSAESERPPGSIAIDQSIQIPPHHVL